MSIITRKIDAVAISRKWPGAQVGCLSCANSSTEVIWHTTSPVPKKTEAEIITAQDEYEAWLADAAAQKSETSMALLNTPINKTLRDVLWEICQAVRGSASLPNETKAAYTVRLKAMLEANLP